MTEKGTCSLCGKKDIYGERIYVLYEDGKDKQCIGFLCDEHLAEFITKIYKKCDIDYSLIGTEEEARRWREAIKKAERGK